MEPGAGRYPSGFSPFIVGSLPDFGSRRYPLIRMLNDDELKHLRRCVELAGEALAAGDEPFGSVLVAADGARLAEDRNRVASGDRTRHPEFALARWAAANMPPEERAAATVFTSGEHCPMCAAAHGWRMVGPAWAVLCTRAPPDN